MGPVNIDMHITDWMKERSFFGIVHIRTLDFLSHEFILLDWMQPIRLKYH